MNRWNANHYIAVALLAGFLVMIAGLAGAAERFKAKLEVCKPGEPCEVRHLYTVKTTCETDLPSVANLLPSGSLIACRDLKR